MGQRAAAQCEPDRPGHEEQWSRDDEQEHRLGHHDFHRSSKTVDSFIADHAIGLSAGMTKTGAPCRSERLVKYNHLLRIEKKLGDKACYASADFRNGVLVIQTNLNVCAAAARSPPCQALLL
ncbi:hypothetical protein PybrP1_005441 [[Pythium] brassicae (nom. inval.)]|nr:hypothetical protein PybrP1_005441 [[Pythium] brassicae (nom. inval.)]